MAHRTALEGCTRGILKERKYHELDDGMYESGPTESGDDADSESSDSYIVDAYIMSDVEDIGFCHSIDEDHKSPAGLFSSYDSEERNEIDSSDEERSTRTDTSSISGDSDEIDEYDSFIDGAGSDDDSDEYCIDRRCFVRIVREITRECGSHVCFEAEAIDALQGIAEDWLSDVFDDALSLANCDCRDFVEPADFQFVVRLRREGCVRAVFHDIIRLVRSGGVMGTDEINKLADKLRDGQHGRLYMDVRLGTVEIGEPDSQMVA